MIHGGAPVGWLEFSANLNPTGTPARVAAAVATATYDRYADVDTTAAEAHLALDAGVAADSVLLTAGATEAIRLVAAAHASRGRSVVVGPTYSEYARQARQAGATVATVDAEPPAFDPPVDLGIGRLESEGVFFICDPNNPTGRGLDAEGTRRLLVTVPRGVTLLLDQSFAPFAPSALTASECIAGGNVVLVRSLTKALAAPGLRLGYVIAPPGMIATLRDLQDPWAVSAHAVAAAAAASWTLPPDIRDRVATWRDRLTTALASAGLHVLPSDTNFLLVHVGPTAPAFVAALAEQRIAVRSCTSFGLPEHVRIAVRPPAEQDALLRALSAIGLTAR